jgi:hypothetical protein
LYSLPFAIASDITASFDAAADYAIAIFFAISLMLFAISLFTLRCHIFEIDFAIGLPLFFIDYSILFRFLSCATDMLSFISPRHYFSPFSP